MATELYKNSNGSRSAIVWLSVAYAVAKRMGLGPWQSFMELEFRTATIDVLAIVSLSVITFFGELEEVFW